MIPPVVLTPGTRRITLAALIVSSLVGINAATSALGMTRLSEAREETRLAFSNNPLLAQVAEAELAAQDTMRNSRGLILWGLAVSCALGFIAAGRMIRPAGVSRESMRRLASLSFLGAAVFRTLDGAQMTVISKKMTVAMAASLAEDPQFKGVVLPPELASLLGAATAIGMTVVFAGGFALLSQFYRSERVRAQTVALDQRETQ
ncbi:MAG: hypothetical protein ACT4TC_19205 [Myxococcaceae bacterium]